MADSRASTGAASELVACAYLLIRGFHVFRSVSPACPVDAVAFRPGEMPIKVEIKSLSRSTGCVFAWPKNDEWDLLLVVGSEGHVFEIGSGTSRIEAINTIRAFYGLPPVGTTRTAGGFPPAPREHGTPRGYRQHKYDGTEICDDCRRACREDSRIQAQDTRKRVREEYDRAYPLTGQ